MVDSFTIKNSNKNLEVSFCANCEHPEIGAFISNNQVDALYLSDLPIADRILFQTMISAISYFSTCFAMYVEEIKKKKNEN